jgi:hypothetical protein
MPKSFLARPGGLLRFDAMNSRKISACFVNRLTGIVLLTAGLGCEILASGADGEIAAIEVMREVQLEAAARPLNDLEVKYREALEKKRVTAQGSGNLDYLMAVRAELDLLAEGDEAAAAPQQADLAKLRQIYREQKTRLASQVESAMLAADRDFAKEMNTLILDLTKAGKADEALKVRTKLDAFIKEAQAKRLQAAAPKPAADDPALEEDEKGVDALKKLLTSGAWSWHVGDTDTPSHGAIRFLETGAVSGISWLSGWETIDASSFKIIFQKNPNNYWVFKLAKNRKTAESVEGDGAMKGPKSLKYLKE